ncbi:MAG TPA: BadF/BadG/BcrA/BcrD ATPase family protein, partial [Ktedonobacterales bacterium]
MSDDAARTGYALGIDGGGTKTHAVVVDARGRIRGEGYAGSANHEAVGLARAAASLRDAAGAALSAAGCGGPPDAAWVGLAGIDSSRDVRAWQSRLSNLARRVRLMNDAELPLCALPHRAGIALIAGTGSIALGRDSAGATARAGGWGHTLGDEGSGYAIGRQALQAVTRAADGRGPHTALSERILAHWGLAHPEELFARVYPTIEKGDIAQLAPFVLEAAHEG